MPPAGRRLAARDTWPLRAPPSAGCGTGNAGHLRQGRLLGLFIRWPCAEDSEDRPPALCPRVQWPVGRGAGGQCQPTVKAGAAIGDSTAAEPVASVAMTSSGRGLPGASLGGPWPRCAALPAAAGDPWPVTAGWFRDDHGS